MCVTDNLHRFDISPVAKWVQFLEKSDLIKINQAAQAFVESYETAEKYNS